MKNKYNSIIEFLELHNDVFKRTSVDQYKIIGGDYTLEIEKVGVEEPFVIFWCRGDGIFWHGKRVDKVLNYLPKDARDLILFNMDLFI